MQHRPDQDILHVPACDLGEASVHPECDIGHLECNVRHPVCHVGGSRVTAQNRTELCACELQTTSTKTSRVAFMRPLQPKTSQTRKRAEWNSVTEGEIIGKTTHLNNHTTHPRAQDLGGVSKHTQGVTPTPSPAPPRTWNFQAQDPAALPARLCVGRIGHRRHQNRLPFG